MRRQLYVHDDREEACEDKQQTTKNRNAWRWRRGEEESGGLGAGLGVRSEGEEKKKTTRQRRRQSQKEPKVKGGRFGGGEGARKKTRLVIPLGGVGAGGRRGRGGSKKKSLR